MLAEGLLWRGADRAFAWSFYSQGTGRMTDAERVIEAALGWFGDDTPKGLSLWDRGERLADTRTCSASTRAASIRPASGCNRKDGSRSE